MKGFDLRLVVRALIAPTGCVSGEAELGDSELSLFVEDSLISGRERHRPALRRRADTMLRRGVGLMAAFGVAACTARAPEVAVPVRFDTATVWFHTGADSVSMTAEVARTQAQRERGLAGRSSLPRDAGMLFEFDAMQSPEDGFWMWGAQVPLDVAFIDADREIRRIVTMEVCEARMDDCPNHPAGIEYASAVEANAGWFRRNGIDVGDTVSISHR